MSEETYKFSCPVCEGRIEATPDWYGQRGACPHCSHWIEVPYPTILRKRFQVMPQQGELRTMVVKQPLPARKHGSGGPEGRTASDQAGKASKPSGKARRSKTRTKPWWNFW